MCEASPGHDRDMRYLGHSRISGVTLVVTHYNVDMEPYETISFTQAGTPIKHYRHQAKHKTFNPKFIMAIKNVGMEDGIAN